jgi:hypothetical protein
MNYGESPADLAFTRRRNSKTAAEIAAERGVSETAVVLRPFGKASQTLEAVRLALAAAQEGLPTPRELTKCSLVRLPRIDVAESTPKHAQQAGASGERPALTPRESFYRVAADTDDEDDDGRLITWASGLDFKLTPHNSRLSAAPRGTNGTDPASLGNSLIPTPTVRYAMSGTAIPQLRSRTGSSASGISTLAYQSLTQSPTSMALRGGARNQTAGMATTSFALSTSILSPQDAELIIAESDAVTARHVLRDMDEKLRLRHQQRIIELSIQEDEAKRRRELQAVDAEAFKRKFDDDVREYHDRMEQQRRARAHAHAEANHRELRMRTRLAELTAIAKARMEEEMNERTRLDRLGFESRQRVVYGQMEGEETHARCRVMAEQARLWAALIATRKNFVSRRAP